jgi:membrane carboxypeptidase/penicillin-binding protein
MGAFDTINCEYDLPNYRYLNKKAFQTKSLDCFQDDFLITKEGDLINRGDRWCPQNKLEKYNGWINFYDLVYLDENLEKILSLSQAPKGTWRYTLEFQFSAEFFRGKIQSLIDNSIFEEVVYDEAQKTYTTINPSMRADKTKLLLTKLDNQDD